MPFRTAVVIRWAPSAPKASVAMFSASVSDPAFCIAVTVCSSMSRESRPSSDQRRKAAFRPGAMRVTSIPPC